MSTDSEKNAGNSKKSKHFFPGLGTCIPPALNTCVDTLCELINFSDIKPGNIFTVNVRFRKCVDNRDGGFRDVGDR
jgi:hypothetical protein